MTVSLRAASPSQLRNSLAAVRAWLLLMLFALFAGSAVAQSLSPGGPLIFGPVQLGTTSTQSLTFTAPPGGTTIQSVSVVTEGTSGKDFTLVSDTGCIGFVSYFAQCHIVISFSPSQIGPRQGALSIVDGTGTVVNLVYLSGVGVGSQFVFAPATATTTATASTLSPASFTAGAAVQDSNGNLFFTDVLNNRILERSSTNVYSVITTTLPLRPTSGITIDGLGNLYVSSGVNVWAIMSGSTTPTILATPGVTLSTPTGLAVDAAGDLYIADSTNNKIYQMILGATSPTASALVLTGTGVPLSGPTGLAIDYNNNLFIADSNNDRIVIAPLANFATTVLSLPSITLSNPTGVAVDGAGTVYIANTGGGNVIEVTVTAAEFILADPALALTTPSGIVIKPNGDLVIADTTRGLIDVPRSSPAINFPTPTVVGTLDATDDPESLVVQNSGNLTADLTFSPTTTNPSISTAAFQLGTAPSAPCPILNAGAAVTPADAFSPGEVCLYGINFKPTVVGLNSANLIFATTAVVGGMTTSNTVPLTGIGLSTIKSFKLVAIPSTINKGGTVELILTALNADGVTIATDYVGTVTFTTSDTTGLYLGGTSPNTNSTTYTFTAANNGVLTIPATTGLQLNQYGVFTASATDGTYSATSNNINVVEPSTLNLTSSINPSLINQSTTFTLSVTTTGTITPGGSVTFYSNGVQIGSPVALGPTGTASISDSFATVGNYNITATYTSTTNTQGGTASLTQVVGLPTAVVLTSSINPSLVNQSTTLTATISAIASPTGTVTFYNGATALGTATVNGTTATLSVSFPTGGTFPLTAIYTTTNPSITGATSPVLSQVVENLASLTLNSSVNPSQINQSTILTANLTALGSPTGTVKFYDGATLLGTATLTGGVASISVSFAAAGTHPLKAVYSGDTLTQPATATLAQVVLNTAAVTLTSSVNPSLVGQPTTLTATLTAAGTPTGTVKFYQGATLIGTTNLVGTTASISVSFSTAGTFPLTAVYSGDPNTQTATSAALSQVVLNVASLTLTSSVNPSQPNQTTTLTANLTALGTPTGTVKFYDGVTLIGTANLTGATASISASFATPGTHTLRAVYSGDTNTSSAMATLAQVVLNFSTVTLTSSVNPSLVGQSTTLIATLAAAGSPTGTVKFYDGTTLIGTTTLVGTSASVSVSFATAGSHPITAVYSGDANTTPGTSGVLSQVVLNVTSITLTSSVNPSQLNQSTTLTANVTALGSPTGTVKFYDGTNLIGTANLTGATASISVAFSTSGTHNLKAVYSGDVNTSPATATLAQVVLNVTTITLTTSVNPVLVNANTTLTSTVTSAGTLTGTVTFYAGANKLGTATLNGGVASLAVSFPTAGIYSLTAVYSGDANNQTATSAPISQTVLNVTTVALTTSINPVLLDNPTILSAILTSTGPTPTGTVSFFDGGTPLGVVTLVNGTASISASFVYAGTHTITALYSGDTVTAPASAPALSQTVADFSFAVASGTSSSASTIAGGTAGYSLLLSPLITTTLPSAVTITVAGLPSTATFVLTPATAAAGSGATPVAFNVTAAQIVAAIRTHLPPAHRSPARYAPVALGFLALPLAWFRRRKRFGSLLASVCLLLAITGGLTGCISDPASGYYGQTPQSYNVTVTATSGNLARSTYLTLTIQ